MSLNSSLANIYKHRNKASPGAEETMKETKRQKLEEISLKGPSGYPLEKLGLRADTYEDVVDECSHIVEPIMPISERCILITGQRGVGKSTLIKSIATYTKMPLVGCDLAKGVNRSYIKFLFQTAIKHQPCLLYIDRLDRAYIQANLSTGIADEIYSNLNDLSDSHHRVFILLATREAESIDKDLDDHIVAKIELRHPDHCGRIQIMKNLIEKMNKYNKFFAKLGDADIQDIASRTNLYAPKDFVSLFNTVRRVFRSRVRKSSIDGSHHIRVSDFYEALARVVPILKQQGFEEIPNVTWDDVGGLDKVKKEIRISILNQIHKDSIDIYYDGILLYGPPGCGKTLVAKAVANEAGLNFISVNSIELMNKFYGETEANITRIFSRARQCEPCMIFFDEFDAISEKRPDHQSGHSGVKSVQAFLTQLDGFKRRGCFVMAATNRLDSIDTAMLRSGRFGTHLRVGLPKKNDRESILRAIMRKNPDPKIDIPLLAEKTSTFSGADLYMLVKKARLLAMHEDRQLEMKDFHAYIQKIMRYKSSKPKA